MTFDIETLHEENTAFSPNLPGLQIAWDSTSLGRLKTCPRKYYYEAIEGWQPRGKALPLIFGIHYHSALEEYDHAIAAGIEHEDAVRQAVALAMRVQDERDETMRYMHRDSDDTSRNRENLVRAIIWYLEHFKHDPAETVVLKNGKPAVELTFKMEIPLLAPGGDPMLLCGHMDRVVEFAGDIYVMDHKTTKGYLNDKYWQSYSPNNQVSLYTLASTVVLGERAKGVIISACQLAVNFCRFARRPIHRTQSQTLEWLEESQHWIMQAQRYAEQNYWPMNEMSCGNYGGCAFRKVCSADPSMRPHLLKSNFHKKIWNPMKER